MLYSGQIVHNYVIEGKPLGTGAVADVYRVTHRLQGTVHALKYMKFRNPEIRERLWREAEINNALSHPNVVRLYEVIDVDGHPCLVMELIQGPTLAAWLEREHPPLGAAERIFRGIVAGVSHAHEFGLVHRDLKPANVLLDDPHGLLVPKVVDFGIAKMMAMEDTDVRAASRTVGQHLKPGAVVVYESTVYPGLTASR